MKKIAKLPRRAIVTGRRELTSTGTFLVSFRVDDDEPFDFEPGQFVGIDCVDPELGYLSGNGAMIAEMSEALAAVGVGQDRVLEEYFFNTRFRPRWEDVEAIAARFSASAARNLFADLPRR